MSISTITRADPPGPETVKRPTCKDVIAAADKALAAKDKAYEAASKTITDQTKIIADQQATIDTDLSKLHSVSRNPIAMGSLGITTGLLFGLGVTVPGIGLLAGIGVISLFHL